MTLNTTRSKEPHICVFVQFQSVPYTVSDLHALLRQVHDMISNDLEHYEVKNIPYMFN